MHNNEPLGLLNTHSTRPRLALGGDSGSGLNESQPESLAKLEI